MRRTILVLLSLTLLIFMFKMVHPIVTLIAVGIICLCLGLIAGGIICLLAMEEEEDRGPRAKAADEADAKRLAESLAKMIKEGATDDCSICMCDLTHPVITPCAHVFCLFCMAKWLDRRPRPGCPLCRLPCAVKNLTEASTNIEEETVATRVMTRRRSMKTSS